MNETELKELKKQVSKIFWQWAEHVLSPADLEILNRDVINKNFATSYRLAALCDDENWRHWLVWLVDENVKKG